MEELRNKVYEWSLELINEGKISQGLILVLATWNFASFRYKMREFKLTEFENAIRECDIDYFKGKNFKDIDLDNIKVKDKIINIYTKLSAFEGVKYVGASKVMHFLCPKVFVMWDTEIIKEYKAKTSPEGYVEFMKKMQGMYNKGMFEDLDKSVSIPRAIDIYNMIKFSQPGIFEPAKKRIDLTKKHN